MTKQFRMTEARKETFLLELARHGLVTIAAKAASPHSKNGCHVSFYEERDRDPEFKAAWEAALEIADEVTIKEIHRRGIEGYESPVWGSGGPGEGTVQVGTEIKHSDKMAELFGRIQSLRIRQALTSRVELDAKVETTDKSLGLKDLSPENQALLQQILDSHDQAK
jgi:hypothetical protein